MATQATLEDIEKARWLISHGYIGTDDVHLLADQLAERREREKGNKNMKIDPTSIIEYTHQEFVAGINNIAAQVIASEFKPNLIVGIVRGGAVPAVYLSHKLKVPVSMVHWSTCDKTNALGNESNCWIPEWLLEGKRILLVDDIVDGGDTIRELLEDWQSSVRDPLPLNNLRISAMYYNTAQATTVDFYHREIDRNVDQRWVVFPWE